tara:strand:+ start:259 stop:534 length:276 start_codon:yes stop_codon:yes gene_type:complete
MPAKAIKVEFLIRKSLMKTGIKYSSKRRQVMLEAVIRKVLKSYKGKQLNLDSSATVNVITKDIMTAIVNDCYYLNLGNFPKNKYENDRDNL